MKYDDKEHYSVQPTVILVMPFSAVVLHPPLCSSLSLPALLFIASDSIERRLMEAPSKTLLINNLASL